MKEYIKNIRGNLKYQYADLPVEIHDFFFKNMLFSAAGLLLAIVSIPFSKGLSLAFTIMIVTVAIAISTLVKLYQFLSGKVLLLEVTVLDKKNSIKDMKEKYIYFSYEEQTYTMKVTGAHYKKAIVGNRIRVYFIDTPESRMNLENLIIKYPAFLFPVKSIDK